ncbi:hypothetical protein D8M04_15215 [Oceanobacillus piezotolerans]|uniref:GNAT family N-acetyltransferase n=1 Tax=Oceanobacillus piezotolerans TaxID=2448030 RepID=A0A498D9B9_9BACI|nr:hypothetical protein [Oceanobacillus piezotolerans]RLL42896.1 hypothetical protein D8M04_15215 [Oceanobacillus piezotolerans]
MRILPACEAPFDKLEAFLRNNEGLDRTSLTAKGYVVEIKDKIEGCFVLEEVEENKVYWLKQLYITRTEANKLPVLVETILALAKTKQAKRVYVHSHQPIVDLLLQALQFHPQKEVSFVDKHPESKGNWWSYQVS